MKITEIRIGKRTRKDLGDIDALAASIKEVGLLHLPVVTSDGALICGERRLAAVKKLGWSEIPVRSVRSLEDALLALKAERDENTCREPFRPTEALAMAEKLEAILKPEAEKRRAEGGKIAGRGRPKKAGAETAQAKTRDAVAGSVGLGRTKLAAVKEVVTAAKADPSLAPVVAEMDRTGNVSKAKSQIAKAARKQELKVAVWPQGKFRVIYADPPWPYNDQRTGMGGATGVYDTMQLEDICKLDVPDICTKECVLFLWITSPLLPDGIQVLQRWGFTYKASFIWNKVNGFMGHYNDVKHEILLIGTKGSCLPETDKLEGSIISVKKDKHSKKPEAFRELIDRLYPSGPRVELFARAESKGWTSWGNEII